MVPRLLVLLVATSTAQGAVEDRTGRIEGKVVFRDGLRPAGGLTVVAYPRCGKPCVTDDKGHYVIDGLRGGEYTVEVGPPSPRMVVTLGHYATASVKAGAATRLDLKVDRRGRIATGAVQVAGARFGWAGLSPRRGWLPARVTVENVDYGLKVGASVQARDRGLAIAYSRRVDAPAQAELDMVLAVPAGLDDRGGRANAGPRYRFQLLSGTKCLHKGRWLVRVLKSPLCLAIGTPESLPGWVRDLVLPSSNGSVVFMPVRLEELPEHWQAYGAASAVVIGGKLERPFRAAQRDALVSWVRSGGRLIASGMMAPQDVKGTFLEDLLPVQLVGSRDLDRLTGLTQRYGGSIAGNGDWRVCEAFVADGRAAVGQDELPLIAVRHLGFGAVVFLAFDWRAAAFQDWSGCGAMWEELMGLGGRRPIDVNGSALVCGKDRVEEILSQVVGMRVLCGRAVGASVAAYVATAGLLYVFFKRRQRVEFAWVALLAIALVWGAAVHALGVRARGERTLSTSEVSVAQTVAGERTAVVDGYVGIWSPKGSRLNVTLQDRHALAERAGAGASGSHSLRTLTISEDDLCRVEGFAVDPGGLRAFRASSIVDLGGTISADFRTTTGGLRGVITNSTRHDLEDCFLMLSRYVQPIGDLPRGETKTVTVGDAGYGGPHAQFSTRELRSQISVTREMIREALFTSIMRGLPVTEDFTLFGWARQPVLDLVIEDEEPTRVAHSLVAVRLALPTAEGAVRIPKGVCRIDVAPFPMVALYQRWSWKPRTKRGGELEACFVVPAEWRDVRPRCIRVFFKCRLSGNLRAALSAYDWTAQQWVGLKAAASTQLTDPERFYRRPQGQVKLRVSVVERRRASEDEAERMNRWQIEDLDLEIEGEAARD